MRCCRLFAFHQLDAAHSAQQSPETGARDGGTGWEQLRFLNCELEERHLGTEDTSFELSMS